MKKILTISLAILTVAGVIGVLFPEQALEAAGHIGLSNVIPTLRTREVEYRLQTANTAAGNSTDTTQGLGGVIMVEDFLNAGGTLSNTSTISALPYPCKVVVYAKDITNNSTLGCTGTLTICGYNQFGQPASFRTDGGTCETISTDLVEGTPLESARVYERVTSVSMATCTGGVGSADDLFIVACGLDIGLPLPVNTYAGVISVCLGEDSDAVQCFSGSVTDEAGDSGSIDLDDDAINLVGVANTTGALNAAGIGEDDVGGDVTIDDDDTVYIRVRFPSGL